MEEDRGNCPNCGHSRINVDSCIKCGIVFAKFQRVIPEDISEITQGHPTKRKGSGRGRLILILIPLLIAACTAYNYFSPDVKVYVEGSYTQTEVEAYVYADVNVSCLYSFGAQLVYHPSQLSIIEVEGNADFSYSGNQEIYDQLNIFVALPPEVPEADPPFDQIFFSGNKLYNCGGSYRCNDCISGDKVMLGKVTFAINDSSMPFDPSLLFIAPIRGKYRDDGGDKPGSHFIDDKYSSDFIKANGPAKNVNQSSGRYVESRKVKCGPVKIEEAI